MSRSQGALVVRARELADRLVAVSPPVTRNVLYAIVSGFLAGAGREELSRVLPLLAEGSGGHRNRSGSFGEQMEAAVSVLTDDLEAIDLPDADYRTVLGWTARFLDIEEEKRKRGGSNGQSPRKKGSGGSGNKRGNREKSPESPRQEKKASRLMSLDSRSMSALEAFKEHLENGSGEKEEP